MAEDPRDPPGPRAPDDYEAAYMGKGGVLYRDKIKTPKSFLPLLSVPLVVQAITFSTVALSGKPMPAAVWLILPLTTLFVALIGLLFTVLRVTVTREEVIIQYGLFGPKIPVSRIQDVQAVKYDWRKYGGFGIRRGRDGSWAYNMMGDRGRACRIEWLDSKGKKQVLLVASPDPEALARAIQQARGAAAPRARIATEPRDAEFEAEAEAEAEAVLADEEKKRAAEK